MKPVQLVLGAVVITAIVLALPLPLSAASRTWVSGRTGSTKGAINVGDDDNPCTRLLPCATFTGALKNTDDGGEIDALDPVGSPPVTIDKSVTIDGRGMAGIIPDAKSDAIKIDKAGVVVTLRNLSLNGKAGSAATGISLTNGAALHIEHCVIANFSGWGLSVKPTAAINVSVHDSTFTGNGLDSQGKANTSDGGAIDILAFSGSGGVRASVSLDQLRIEHNRDGVVADGRNGGSKESAIDLTMRDSTALGSTLLNGVTAISAQGKATVRLTVDRSLLASNALMGVDADHASVFVTNSTMTLNGAYGVLSTNDGTVHVQGATVAGNNVDGLRADNSGGITVGSTAILANGGYGISSASATGSFIDGTVTPGNVQIENGRINGNALGDSNPPACTKPCD